MLHPQASVVLLCFEQAAYVREAVRSILGQTGIELEIVVSDDCSRDGTFEVLTEEVAAYRGPHRVVLRQNTERLGNDHLERMMRVASTDFIVLAHGDDMAMPDRCAALYARSVETGASVVSSNAIEIDGNGRELGLATEISQGPLVALEAARNGLFIPAYNGAMLAWRREVFTEFPWLDRKYLPIGHDILIAFRGSLLGGTAYVQRPLLYRRRHAGQWSNRLVGGKSHLEEQEGLHSLAMSVRMAMARDLAALPASEQLQVVREAMEAANRETLARWINLRDELQRQGRRCAWREAGDAPTGPWALYRAWLQEARNALRAGRWRIQGIGGGARS